MAVHEPTKSAEPEKISEAVLRLAALKTLPPLSPEGRQFATDVHQGIFKYADVAGESLARFLQGGLPGCENIFGEEKAHILRSNVEMLRRGDPKELHDLLLSGRIFETADKWSTGEKSKVSRYPMPICTSGVTMVRPMKQHVIARRNSESDLPTKVRKITNSSPETLWMRQRMLYYRDIGSKYSISLDFSDDESKMESPSARTPTDRFCPVGSTITCSSSSDYDSDEDDSAFEDKVLLEMFPHQRFREFY